MAISAATIDSREPDWVRALTFGGVPTLVMALAAGDIQVVTDDNQILVIERKTPEDLLSTLKADRLFPQCVKMLEASRWAYIVITGIFQCTPLGKVVTCQDGASFSSGNGYDVRRETGWDWAALQGALLTMQEMGIGIIYVANDGEFEKAVIRLAARDRGEVRVLPPRSPDVLGAGVALLAGLPGIGIERAKAILQYAGTPAWALTWLCEPGASDKVPGIGSGTKLAVRQALQLAEDQKLSVISVDDGA